MKEREISLIDLIVEILLSWRSLIAWMVVGAILMGGFSYVSTTRTAAAQKIAQEKQQAEWEAQQALLNEQMKDKEATNEELIENLTEAQKNNVLNVLNNQKVKDFYKQSLYLQMDAANVPKMKLTFLINAPSLEESYSIERLYEDALNNGLQQWLAERENAEDINELVMLTRGTGVSESDSFCVQVIHVTEKQCKELTDLVISYMEELKDNIAKQAGEHQLVLVNQSFAKVRDTAVMDQQKNILANVINYDSMIKNSIATFNAGEKAYYEFLSQVELEEEEVETAGEGTILSEKLEEIVPITPSVSVKYVVLGMLLFAFIWVCWLFLKYVMNNKLRSGDDINAIYNVPQLGHISADGSKKKSFDFVDHLILKLRDRNRRAVTREEEVGLAGAAVKIAANKKGFDAVCCIGCGMKDSTLEVAEAMRKVLGEEGISLNVLNNVLYDQKALRQLQGVKGAFLLEKAGETLYDEIRRELELMNRQDIKVLGVVVVE